MVTYTEIDLMPGVKYFHCENHRSTLSVTSCAAQFKRHKGGCSKCTGCVVGALHAGEKIVARPSKSLCCRCGELVQRLIASKGICVSCQNREYEVLHGKNGKGAPPKPIDVFWGGVTLTKVVVLHPVTLFAVGQKRTQSAAATWVEALVRASRGSEEPSRFVRGGLRRPGFQLCLSL